MFATDLKRAKSSSVAENGWGIGWRGVGRVRLKFGNKQNVDRGILHTTRRTNTNRYTNTKDGRHSSVVSSVLTIMWPRVQIPSTPFMLFSICIFVVGMRKGRINQKEASFCIYFLKRYTNTNRYTWADIYRLI